MKNNWLMNDVLFLFVLDTLAAITKIPQNVIVMKDENATLQCSSSYNDRITWKYDYDIISYVPCTTQSPGFIAQSPRAADCNIVALPGAPGGISGPYMCDDGSYPRAVAMVIVLSKSLR